MPVPSTPEWRHEVVKQFRYTGRAKISMEIVADIQKADVVATSSGNLAITPPEFTLDAQYQNFDKVATMEGVWKADGSMYLLSRQTSENKLLPVMSESQVSPEAPLVLRYDLGQPTAMAGLTVFWDTQHDSWPAELRILGYTPAGEEAYSEIITSVNNAYGFIDMPMDGVQYVTLEILKWSNPELRARVSEVYFGAILELTDKQIKNIGETSTRDYMCAKLPSDTQKYTIKNQIYRELPAAGGVATSQRSHPLTDISRIFNSTAATQGIATVETRYWKADGSLFLSSRKAEENPNVPWMSDTADFDEDNPIEIIITYEHPLQINRIRLVWDVAGNSWPVNATITGRDSYRRVVFESDVSASSVETQITNVLATVKSVHIRIMRWSIVGRRARIGQYEAMVSYGNNNIPSEVNNLFDPTLTIGLSKYLSQRQKIKVQYGLDTKSGTTIWLPEQTRYLDSWNIPTNSAEVTLEANTRLSFLTSTYRRGTYNPDGSTLYDMATDILTNSGIIPDGLNAEPWTLDPALKNFKTVAPLPEKAANALLQLVAGAGCCTLGTNPVTGYVEIIASPPDSEYVIDESVQLETPSISLETPLKSVSIKLYNYTVETESSTLFKGTVVLTGTQKVTIAYEDDACATNCEATVSGATVVSSQFFSYSAVLELSANIDNANVSITITGYKVKSSNVQITTYVDNTVDSGKQVVINNPLITNMDMLNAVASRARGFYSRRNVAASKYLGYPDLKAGDLCALYSQYMNETGFITEHKFDYNGGFNGSVKMLMEV